MRAFKKCRRSDPVKRRKDYDDNIRLRKLNPERYKKYDRQRNLKKKFGITAQEYEHLFTVQNGCCAICGKQEVSILNGKVKRLSVDHDHQSGEIRGLLCSNCNTALGLFQDNITILKQAIDYLRLHGCVD
jgi:hypothetical protein